MGSLEVIKWRTKTELQGGKSTTRLQWPKSALISNTNGMFELKIKEKGNEGERNETSYPYLENKKLEEKIAKDEFLIFHSLFFS